MDSRTDQTQETQESQIFEALPDDEDKLWTVVCIVDEGIIKKKKMYKVWCVLLFYTASHWN